MGLRKHVFLAATLVASVSALPAGPEAVGTLAHDQASDLYGWVAAGPDDRRSPCPMLNSLANHGWLPHDGQNISLADLVKVLSDSVNLTPEATKFVSQKAFKKTSTGRPDTLNLDDLDLHGNIEHDGSLSREDCAVGDCVHFSQDIWDRNTLEHFTDPVISIGQAAKVRNAAVARAKDVNPGYDLPLVSAAGALLETTIYLALFGDVSHGNANRDWVEVLFREERIPYREGFKRSETPLALAPLMVLAAKVQLAMIV